MRLLAPDWDYLILTASSPRQAAAYREQLDLRRSLGFLHGVKTVLVVPDPGGRRVGSGGSTLACLHRILEREIPRSSPSLGRPSEWESVLSRLRILIIHAGGDSKRLPPYAAWGKIFAPVPGDWDGAPCLSLFDRQISNYLDLPPHRSGLGQVVVSTGDVLLLFDAGRVRFAGSGITGLGWPADPETAGKHGVYCPDGTGRVRRFLQKPSAEELERSEAGGPAGRPILDLGVVNFDPASAVKLLRLGGTSVDAKGRLSWSGPAAGWIEDSGLDLYREILCALGAEETATGYMSKVRASGSNLPAAALRKIFRSLSGIPLSVDVIARCGFLHFGTLRELVETGQSLLDMEKGMAGRTSLLDINNAFAAGGHISGVNSWIEGCRIAAPLVLSGGNVVVGIDVEESLSIPPGCCLDVLEGRSRSGRGGWFVRVYGIDDVFNLPSDGGGRLCGRPVESWLEAMDARPDDVWGSSLPRRERSVWNGRFFPLVEGRGEFRKWLWLWDPSAAGRGQKKLWKKTARYSFEEMARLASHDGFDLRRRENRAAQIRSGLGKVLLPGSCLSARELAFLLLEEGKTGRWSWVESLLWEAHRREVVAQGGNGLEGLELARVLHTLGSALLRASRDNPEIGREFPGWIRRTLGSGEKEWLGSLGLGMEMKPSLTAWAERAREAAFGVLSRRIARGVEELPEPPRNVLRGDEIVWGRAPARLDLGGGWTDTPPYSLERGGCVINAAVDLNGQAPIQAYARVIERPEVRINSIDHSTRVVIRSLQELLDFRRPGSQFALAKAALVLCGFSPATAAWPGRSPDLKDMLRSFGGGVELTTLAAIPSGSGLGTSSIMGAVLLSVIHRMSGRTLSQRELFHAVLRLEQELTTGGGWQDQVGGVLEGVKVISSGPGLVPDLLIHFVPSDLLDRRLNGERTLLYYTGFRRLAKNILREVVGRYLDRDRAAMETLSRLHDFPPHMAEVMASKDIRRFGELLDLAWRLNVDLDPDHSTPAIEDIRARIHSRSHGSKLLGAGGGGFLLIVARSPEDGRAIQADLKSRPPNEKARFFEGSVSREGLVVTVC